MRRPPRSTRTDTLVPTRRSSDLACRRRAPGRRQYPPHPPPSPARACPPETRPPRNPARPVPWGPKRCALLPLPVLLTQVAALRRSPPARKDEAVSSYHHPQFRSEEIRVGNACVSTCRYRGSTYL